jgi:hypothetical protein
MRKMRFRGVRFVLFGIAALIIAGLVTSGLWNVLMPAIFGIRAITFWQALGLLLLSRLFFGRFGGRGPRRRSCGRGWKDLTPEERERFSATMGPEARR